MKKNFDKTDPFLGVKKKARYRVVGVFFFSIVVLMGGNFLFELNPNHLSGDFIVELPEEVQSRSFLVGEYKKLHDILGRPFSEEDLRILKSFKKKIWYVEVGLFLKKSKVDMLSERLILEGYAPETRKRKVGEKIIFSAILGPYNFFNAEMITKKLVSKGLKADINRF